MKFSRTTTELAWNLWHITTLAVSRNGKHMAITKMQKQKGKEKMSCGNFPQLPHAHGWAYIFALWLQELVQPAKDQMRHIEYAANHLHKKFISIYGGEKPLF